MDAGAKTTLRALVAIVFFTYVGQNLLNTSLAPMARVMHLPEWIMGATISSAALMGTLLSQRWGRLSISWGRRPVLVTSLTLACIAGWLFAITAWAATMKLIVVGFAAAGVIVSRGLLFGTAVAAVPPTGQALIAAITPDERSRIRGMSLFGGAFNASIMCGSLLSALLAAFWLMAPVYATPLMVTISLCIAIFAIPRTPPPALSAKLPVLRMTDRRLLPYIVSGFGLSFTLGAIQILLGFLIQDRFHVEPKHVIEITGIIMLVQAAGALTSQLLIVPRLPWRPVKLMRTGIFMTILALIIIALPLPSPTYLGVGTALLGTGAGFFAPGYNAGASLVVKPEEQGGVAGLLNACNSFTWMLAPVTATAVYSWNHNAPFMISGAVIAVSAIVSLTHPQLRRHVDNLRCAAQIHPPKDSKDLKNTTDANDKSAHT